MKFNVGMLSIFVAALGSFLYLSGVGGLWIDYAPSVGTQAIAAAHGRAYVQLFCGVVTMLIAAVMAGVAVRASPKLAATSAAILAGASLFPLGFWLIG
jgi:hypothetical protein